jgi:hypothetical protein
LNESLSSEKYQLNLKIKEQQEIITQMELMENEDKNDKKIVQLSVPDDITILEIGLNVLQINLSQKLKERVPLPIYVSIGA